MFLTKLDYKLGTPWIKWLILGFLGLCITIIRLPTFWESLWYGDENIYLAVAHGLSNSQKLYQDVWDNKPPLLYLIYCVSYQISGVNVWGFRLINLGFSLLALVSFWHLVLNLGRDLFRVRLVTLGTVISTVFFGMLLGFGWEMTQLNAENVYMPLIILGLYFWSRTFREGLAISVNRSGFNYLAVGICFSLACFTKIHAVAEIGVLLYLILWQSWERQGLKLGAFVRYQLPRVGLVIGLIALPYFGLIVWYLSRGLGSILYYSLLGFGSDYVARNSPLIFGLPIFGYPTSLITNLQFRLLLLVGLVAGLSFARFKKLISYQYMFIALWLGACFFGAMISERNYPHYLIQVFGALSLLVFGLVDYLGWSQDLLRLKVQSVIAIVLLLNMGTMIFGSGQVIPIYETNTWNKFSRVLVGSMSLADYQRSNNPGAWDRAKILLPIIDQYTVLGDKIYLVANDSELYPLSNRVSGHRQITDFQYDTSIDEVYRVLVSNKTKLIIIDNNSPVKKQFDKLLGQNYVLLPVGGLGGRYEVWVLRP